MKRRQFLAATIVAAGVIKAPFPVFWGVQKT
jgi:hypothetical protein